MKTTKGISEYILDHKDEAFDLLRELAVIPAPSNDEGARAEFCLKWLKSIGADNAYIDDALNVILPIGVTEDVPVTVFSAHSDVVFPDTDPLPFSEDEERMLCPGIGDDTANVVALLMTAKYIIENKLEPKDIGVLLVVNSGEEGLGNLKGSRKLVEDFGERMVEYVTFDGYISKVTNRAVGSKRFRVEFYTEGGHSYAKFGNKNAIACLSRLICDLYGIEVPKEGKTTYNVGVISGGTSVNTIAQYAEVLYEFRSDRRESLLYMEREFNLAIERAREDGVDIKLTVIGERPCSGDVPKDRLDKLTERAVVAVKANFGIEPRLNASSTDCNIPLSIGIPAVCVSCIDGGGAHTREEYIKKDSILSGIGVAMDMILYHF